MADLVVIGAGLAGMYAGALAARRGLDTIVLARGLGSTHLGSGCVEVHGYRGGYSLLAPDLSSLPPDHPYTQLSTKVIADALAEFVAICKTHNLPMRGDLSANHWLPTALGATRATCLAPESMLAGDLTRSEPMGLARLPGFRDFYPELMAANLPVEAQVLDLPLPGAPTRRDAYATDLARLLDNPNHRERIVNAWQEAWNKHRAENGANIARLGVPAILGLTQTSLVLADLQNALDCPIFEISLLPPSVPGIRVFNALRAELLAHGGRLVLGPSVHGEISRHGTAKITARATERDRPYPAKCILLASGGFAHGGLLGEQDGQVRESVFNLPVAHSTDRAAWTSANYFDAQPYAAFGVQTNADGQPVDAHVETIADNLWACGSILSGADRLSEGSREGIDLATAYAAIEHINTVAPNS